MKVIISIINTLERLNKLWFAVEENSLELSTTTSSDKNVLVNLPCTFKIFLSTTSKACIVL